MGEKEAASKAPAIRIGLAVSCVASVLCVAFELFCLGRDLPLLFDADALEQAGSLMQPMITAIAARDALQAVAVVLYCLFVFRAWGGDMFHGTQARHLLVVGALMFTAAVVSALCVAAFPGIAEQEAIPLASSALQADPMQFAFSFMIFALAGVFKYGNLLQEDCDDIL